MTRIESRTCRVNYETNLNHKILLFDIIVKRKKKVECVSLDQRSYNVAVAYKKKIVEIM